MGQTCGPMTMTAAGDGHSKMESGQTGAQIDGFDSVPSDMFGISCCKPKGAPDEPRHCLAMPVCGLTPRLEMATPRVVDERFEFRPCEDLLETEPQGNPVLLHLYDLNAKLAAVNRVTYDLLGAGGAFHASIEVCGIEWSFGSQGINRTRPRQRWQELYRQSVLIGRTSCSKADVASIIREMETEDWTAEGYDVLLRNCGAFADAFCVRLSVGHIPAWVNRFAEASVSSTAWRKVASYLGCESAAMQINAQCQPQQKAFLRSGSQAGAVKRHPVPRLTMNHLGEPENMMADSTASKPSPKGSRNNIGCPLADRTNLLQDSVSRSPNKSQPHLSPQGPTPCKIFQGRRCKAFTLNYDSLDITQNLAECDLNRRDATVEDDGFRYVNEQIAWHD